ncbi:hypothetical protein GF389_02435 [Candidatus Dojkabacteria bacterium]|nr:hypothetical protein [Candidatus Dojkabacteria bacterium]
MRENSFEQEQHNQQYKKENIVDRVINANRKLDEYWRKGVLWFWVVLALFVVLYICNIIFTAIGL